MIMKRRQFLALSGFAALFPKNVLSFIPEFEVELGDMLEVGAVSKKEAGIIHELVSSLVSKYKLRMLPSFVLMSDSIFGNHVAGETVIDLMRTNERVKLEKASYQPKGVVEEKQVLHRYCALRELCYFDNLVSSGKHTLWDSAYLENSSVEFLFRRAILHEIGCNCFLDVGSKKLIALLCNLDVEAKAYQRRKQEKHPAHPSYLSFFHVGDGKVNNVMLDQENAMRTFGEVFALSELEVLPNKPEDVVLADKVKLVCGCMNKYKR